MPVDVKAGGKDIEKVIPKSFTLARQFFPPFGDCLDGSLNIALRPFNLGQSNHAGDNSAWISQLKDVLAFW
jgi:hypothetical protein